MKSKVKMLVTLSLLAALAVIAGFRPAANHSLRTMGPVIHQMVADGDIGDGTSPAKKG
jgi:hypothetical protein